MTNETGANQRPKDEHDMGNMGKMGNIGSQLKGHSQTDNLGGMQDNMGTLGLAVKITLKSTIWVICRT